MKASPFHQRWQSLSLSLSLCLGGGLAVCAVLLVALGQPKTTQAAASSAVPSATISVTIPIDEFDSIFPNSTCSLREAIQAANINGSFGGCLRATGGPGADIINLPAGTYTLTQPGTGEDGNVKGDLDATDPAGLTINGVTSATTLINANGIDRALHAVVGTLTLTNLSVRNGIAPSGEDGGGALFFGAARLTSVAFFNNTATTGGGVYVIGAASVANGLFINNATSSEGGGALFNDITSVTSTIFMSNTATLTGGGASFFGAAHVTDTTFVNNTATDGGGAYFLSVSGLAGSSFRGNTASNGGGAVFLRLAGVSESTFDDNTALAGGGAYFGSAAHLTRTLFNRNSAVFGGGAYFDGATPKQLVNVLFARNTASNGNGATVYVQNADPLQLIHTTIVSSTLASTSAVYVVAGTVYLTNTLVASHTIGIQQLGGSVTEWNSLFSDITTPEVGAVNSNGSISGTAAFVNPALDDYHITQASAALNQGVIPNPNVLFDIDGQLRPIGGGYDIGFDELVEYRLYLPLLRR